MDAHWFKLTQHQAVVRAGKLKCDELIMKHNIFEEMVPVTLFQKVIIIHYGSKTSSFRVSCALIIVYLRDD